MGNIIPKSVDKILKENMLEYFMSIMYDRAIADVRDGCKPIHRHVLWDMYDLKLSSSSPHKKSARVVGDVIGRYSPHGDASAYGALVRMAQPFSLNIPLVDGHGNFGSVDGSSSAAMRYTEVRFDKFTEYNLEALKTKPVDFERNYDETELEPEVLPFKTLMLLVNGSWGIAGGFTQMIMPHNLTEVCNLVIDVVKNPEISNDELCNKLQPDFPTGGIICSKNSTIKAYKENTGTITVRCKTEIHENKNGTSDIIITEIPYMQTTGPKDGKPDSGLLKSIATAVTSASPEDAISNITDISDCSSGGKIDIRLRVKKGVDANTVLNQCWKETKMQTTLAISHVAKNGNHFDFYSIKRFFTEFIEFRMSTIRRSIIFTINTRKKRQHIIDGLVIALNDIDNVVAIIKKSKSKDDAKQKLHSNYELTYLQAEAIVDMRLHQLTSLEINKLKEERKELDEEIQKLEESLSENNVKKQIIKEQKEIISKWGTPRKTEIIEIDPNIKLEDVIAEEDVLIVVGNGNYIKRVPNSFKTQKRNTSGISIGDNDIIDMFSASNKDHILTFTNLGRVFDIKAYNIAEGNIKSKGKKVESYLKLKDGEYATSILCVSNTQMNDSESSLLFVTKNGMIKRTKLEHFSHIMSCGIIATMLKKDDELIAVKYIDSSESMQDIILSTKNGLTVRYEYTEVADTRRDSMGVIGICLKKDDEITDCCIVSSDEQLIFFATKQGLGKVVRVTDMVEKKDPNTKKMVQINDGFPRLKRSSTIKGRMGIRLNEGDELVSLATIDNENQNLMVSTENKLVVVPSGEFRTPIKRDTFGKKLVKLVDGASVKKVIVQ